MVRLQPPGPRRIITTPATAANINTVGRNQRSSRRLATHWLAHKPTSSPGNNSRAKTMCRHSTLPANPKPTSDMTIPTTNEMARVDQEHDANDRAEQAPGSYQGEAAQVDGTPFPRAHEQGHRKGQKEGCDRYCPRQQQNHRRHRYESVSEAYGALDDGSYHHGEGYDRYDRHVLHTSLSHRVVMLLEGSRAARSAPLVPLGGPRVSEKTPPRNAWEVVVL